MLTQKSTIMPENQITKADLPEKCNSIPMWDIRIIYDYITGRLDPTAKSLFELRVLVEPDLKDELSKAHNDILCYYDDELSKSSIVLICEKHNRQFIDFIDRILVNFLIIIVIVIVIYNIIINWATLINFW